MNARELIELADKATPAPWEWKEWKGYITSDLVGPDGQRLFINCCVESHVGDHDARFIEVFNPSTVREMAELLVRVAEDEPIAPDGQAEGDEWDCVYCWNTVEIRHDGTFDKYPHAPDCLWLAVRNFVNGEGE